MARQISFPLPGSGIGLTVLRPVAAVFTMLAGAVGGAIVFEDEFLSSEGR